MFVSRSQLADVERERDEWRKRAEARPRMTTRTEVVVQRAPRWARIVAGSWLLLLGVLAGGVAVPRANDRPTLQEDYPACVEAARDQYAQASEHRGLVNALAVCGVFEPPVAGS